MLLQDCFCSSARRAARAVTARYQAALAAHGLSVPQFELLALLHAGPCNGRAIADAIDIDVATVSRNLRPLLHRKLVHAAANKSDARQMLYGLTPLGTSTLRNALPDWRAAQKRTAEALPQDTLAILHALAQTATD